MKYAHVVNQLNMCNIWSPNVEITVNKVC